MMYAYIDSQTGRPEISNVQPDVEYIEVDDTANVNSVAADPDGRPYLLPEKPDDGYDWDWDTLAWVDGRDDAYYAAVNEALFVALRRKRDQLLAACDWTQTADSPLDAETKSAWATYRQALRDLPENTTDPANPVWPDKPK